MQRPCGLPPYDAKDKRGGNGEAAGMSRGRRPAPRNVVKGDVGRPAPRPPRTVAVMRSPADCVVGGGVPDAPRRGQDPSLRCKGYRGGNGETAGRACPAPTDCRKRVAGERGEGGRQPGPFSRAEVAREWAATHSPSESPSPLMRPAPFDKGASTSPLRGFGGTPDSKVEEGPMALRTDSNTASV